MESTMTQATLQASARTGAGKGMARAARRNGNVPAVIYGNNEKPLLVEIDRNKLNVRIGAGGFFTHILELDVEGKKHKVLARDAQMDPVSDQPMHVDFLRVTDKTEIRIGVPVHIEGSDKSPGVKRGGVVNTVRHEIELFCAAGNIPEHIAINVAELDIGDSIHMADIALPKGARLINTDEKKMTIVTIAAPTAVREEAKAAEAEKAAAAEAAAAAAAAAADPAAAAAAGAAPAAGAAAAPAAGAAAAAPAAKK
jgi:large subunit ribosomal protein L25